MKKLLTILSLSIIMVSCASNSASNNRTKNIEVSKNTKMTVTNKNSDEKARCRQVRKTGSNRPATVCRSKSKLKSR